MSQQKTQKLESATPAPKARVTKLDTILKMLRAKRGAHIQALVEATGWQAHSVRGAIAGQIKRKLGLTVVTERVDGRTIYRIPA